VSTFYLLPPRPTLGDALAGLLQAFFPGLDWNTPGRASLADLLADLAEAAPGAYVLFRDDLPPGESIPRALVEGFGAEAGDEVVEVRPTGRPGQFSARRWRLAPGPAAA
jgi:hypothetical protein